MAGLLIQERQALILMEAIKSLPGEYRDTHIPYRLKVDKAKEKGIFADDNQSIKGIVYFCPRYVFQSPEIIIRLQITHKKEYSDNTKFSTEIKHCTFEIREIDPMGLDFPLGYWENRDKILEEIKSLSASNREVLERFEKWIEKEGVKKDGKDILLEGEWVLVPFYVSEYGMTTDTEWVKNFFTWIISNEGRVWAIPEGTKAVKLPVE